MSASRSVQSLSSGDFADVSSTSRSSSGGLRRSVARSQSTEQHQNAEQNAVSSTHTTPEFEQQCEQRRSSSSLFSMLNSRSDCGGRTSAASDGRQRSSSSLFSEGSIGAGLNDRRSDRTLLPSADRHSTSSNDRTSLFRLPFPQPKRASNRSSSIGSVTSGRSMHSPPQRTSRFDCCQTFDS